MFQRSAVPRKSLALLMCGLFVAGLLALLASAGTARAEGARLAQEKAWDFERFDTDITVQKDGSLKVRETQVANFTGSFTFLTRDLYTGRARFNEGRSYGAVRYKDIRVYTLDGKPYSRFKVEKLKGGRRVRISFSAMNEQKGWVIEYRMTGAVIYAEKYDRVYFNTVSIDRTVGIKNSRSTVTLPPGTDMSKVRATSYPSTDYPPESETSGVDGRTLWWETTGIAPRTTLTVDVAFPKGLVQIPLTYRAWFGVMVLVLVLLAVIAVTGGMIVHWARKGRDTKPEVTVVRYEPPPGMKPAEVGMLIDEMPLTGDITATIVDLAVRGKLVITQQEGGMLKRKKFGFEKQNVDMSDLDPFEVEVIDGLFADGTVVTQDDLKNKFYVHVKDINRELKEQVLAKGFWQGDPARIKGRYSRIAVVFLLLIAPVIFAHSWIDLGYLWALVPGLAVCGLVIYIVGRFMPRRSAEGAEMYDYVLGFKEYLSTAEREEMALMTPENFQANLPYAMRLGVADRWAEKFKDIYTEPPDWYRGYYPGTFSTVYLASSLSDMNTSVGSTLTSSPSSGGGGGFGGGSSGGGFGGGGSGAG